MIPDYDIQIWRKINGICTQLDNDPSYLGTDYAHYGTSELVHEFLMSELISIVATQSVAGQVSEAEVVFDNDPTKKFQAGDVIIIWLGWQGQQVINLRSLDYVACIPTDVGKQVRANGSGIGTLNSYDNTLRIWKVSTSQVVYAGAVMTIVSGTGSGNTSGEGNSSNVQKVFSGVAYEAASQSTDEDKTITLRARDWSFLLLTGKFTASYPSSYEADLIVHDMFAQNKLLISGGTDVGKCDYLLSPSIIEVAASTRQLDFDGEPLIDAMTKVSEATEHDWYIDEEKKIRWFPRRDKDYHIQYRDYPPITPLVLMREDLTDYNVTDPEELLCNKVRVYGKDNKVIPWNYDTWSDSLGSASEAFQWTGLLGSSTTLQPAPPTPKAGTNSIKISGCTTTDWWIWTHPDGWCYVPSLFHPLSLEVIFEFSCPSGKKLRFNKAGCTHWQGGHVEVYYRFGTGPTYTRLVYPDDNITNEDQDLYPFTPPVPFDYVEGPTDTNLFVRFLLTGMMLYEQGCMNNFRVYYSDDSVAGTEKFSARLRIPSPIVIWTDAGTSFWTLVAGNAFDDSEEVKKGTNSYKVELEDETLTFYHDYTVDQYYTSKPNIGVWIYGQDTGNTISLKFWNEVWASHTNGYNYDIIDDFLGWKWIEPPRTDFSNIGTPTGWNHIRCISFIGSTLVSATYFFDWLVSSDPTDEVVDLEVKSEPQTLKFVAAPHYGNLPSGISQFLIRFFFADGNTATTLAQFFGVRGDDWSTIEIPVGADADGWTGTCVGTLQSIEIELTTSFLSPPPLGDYLLIDWIHFEGARWYAESEDATSELANGVRFKELFDDTLFSDTAAARRAVEYIKKFKYPIITIKDVEVDYIGMENLDPGKVLVVDTSVPEFVDMSLDNRSYRIETIEHHIEENDYYVKLTLSLDPVYFEGNVQQISERVRRIEQKGRRKPAANPTEVE